MKTACRLARCHLALYARSSRFALQLTVFLLFVAVLYSTAPAEVVGDDALSAVVLFFLMTWVGFGVSGDPALEQLLLVKAGSAAKAHAGEALFLLTSGALGGAVAVLYPMAVNLAMRGGLYKAPLTAPDVALGFFLQFAAAFSGGVTGWFFHPRVVGDRKLAALLALLTPVLGLVRPGLTALWPPLGAVGWVFPPLAFAALRLSGKAALESRDVFAATGALILYACALQLIRLGIVSKRKF